MKSLRFLVSTIMQLILIFEELFNVPLSELVLVRLLYFYDYVEHLVFETLLSNHEIHQADLNQNQLPSHRFQGSSAGSASLRSWKNGSFNYSPVSFPPFWVSIGSPTWFFYFAVLLRRWSPSPPRCSPVKQWTRFGWRFQGSGLFLSDSGSILKFLYWLCQCSPWSTSWPAFEGRSSKTIERSS